MIETFITHIVTEYLNVIIFSVLLIIMKAICFFVNKYKARTLVKNDTHNVARIKERVGLDVEVYNILYKLLFESYSARVYILQFHNGNVFTTNNPIWRFSKSHEICAEGVKSEIESTQNILIAHMTQLLNPIFNNDPRMCGIDQIGDPNCARDAQIGDFRVYRMSQSTIQHYYISAFLMNRNIQDLIYAPIYDKDNSTNVVGLICLDYCIDGYFDDNVDNLSKLEKDLYTASAKISEKL